ncbi:hypothetical protein [Salinarimonas soli]|uniref:Uncharacterized protein n=1 Tax=Salinarimonas soli TaxID=1638099 RepID=A0A5B2VEP4_9HYPH|nr:hypothetical protein [Salinarimonas soli]KAA2237086.1 hypothetical protein F0L46_11530 [Salinarimonas soli]
MQGARPRRGEGGAPAIGVAALAVALGLAFVVLRPVPVPRDEPPPADAVLLAPPAAWLPIAHATPLFAVAAPELRGLPLVHAARRHREGGREDVLAYGAFSGEGLHLRLAVRAGDPEEPAPSFFIDLVRRASEAGFAVTRSGAPDTLMTKFGPAEAADVALEETVERDCIAFRTDHPEAALRLSGWVCGVPSRPADRQLLACLLDRLTLRAPHEDLLLRAFFAAADEHRNPACAGSTSWLEAPSLRPGFRVGVP